MKNSNSRKPGVRPKVRWGILGAAQIARKNWKAIFHSGNATLAAVASRDIDRSRSFIRECQRQASFRPAPDALGSYEELLARPDIDAVYLPLPTGVRKEWVLRAARAGKHVLCEKPCALSAADLRQMVDACRRNGVQLMDGVMFMHSRRLDAVRAAMRRRDGVGTVKRIASGFSFAAPEEFFRSNIRGQRALEPFGCLGDLGWYCIRFALWVMDWRLPREVTGRLLATTGGAAGVPVEFSADLLFAGGVSAGFYCSFVTEHQQWATVSGTGGSLWIRDFVLPYRGNELFFEIQKARFETRGCDFEMRPQTRQFRVSERSNSGPTSQEARMIRHFSERIRSGKLDPVWPVAALKTQQVLDACWRSARDGGRRLKVES